MVEAVIQPFREPARIKGLDLAPSVDPNLPEQFGRRSRTKALAFPPTDFIGHMYESLGSAIA